MRILMGVPIRVHNEIAEAEVIAFQKMGAQVETSDYGNSGEIKGFIKSIMLIFKNAANLSRKANHKKSEIVYLNTAFDTKTLVRDSITIFFLKTFNKKIKVVLKTHGTIKSIVLSKRNPLKNYLFRKVDLFLVLSKEEYSTFLKAGIKQNKIQITANAIDKTLYSPDKQFRKTFGFEPERMILLFVGRFIEEKGVLDLIYACQLLKKKSVQFKLFCLGDGPLFNKVNGLIRNLNLQNDIQLIGHIPENETKYYYSNCDILILPSVREGFPMAVFQAVAAGKPIITTRINASADHFKEYENCLWIKKNNPEDICEKVLTLSKDTDLREKIRINNLILAKNFTSEKIVENLNIHLQNLLH